MNLLPVLSLGLALAAPLAGNDNVLMVVLDDVGVDRVRAYNEHPRPGRTPTLDVLAAKGVLFRNCWANPFCSPTRATLLTGRYGFRTGIGRFITQHFGSVGLLESEWTLPRVLRRASDDSYRTAALGKWHLAGNAQGGDHPRRMGFGHHAGSFANLGFDPGEWWAYYDWIKLFNGNSSACLTYATTDTTDDALRTIEAFGDDPWFVYVAYNAAHLPYHAPPPHLHDFPLSGLPEDDPVTHHKAMVQALDKELGRLLDGIPAGVAARTTVIVVGDNGTQNTAVEPPTPPSHSKGTLHDGGVRVPLIIAGAGVAAEARGRECAALVNTTDLFATALGLCGVDARANVPDAVDLDTIDIRPFLLDPDLPTVRDLLFAEHFKPNHAIDNFVERRLAVSDGRFKLILDDLTGHTKLYDLLHDPRELRDMLSAEPWPPRVRALRFDLLESLDSLLGR